jgi:transcription-repair coupling factor (superfamily II helicase)
MLKFMRRQADILVSTTIIESGIDIPTANTMIINDADRFGLADLHQLRGRVGGASTARTATCCCPSTARCPRSPRSGSRRSSSTRCSARASRSRCATSRSAARATSSAPSSPGTSRGRLRDVLPPARGRGARLKHEKRPIRRAPPSIEIGVAGVIPKAVHPVDQRRLEAYRRLAIAARRRGPHARSEVDLEGGVRRAPQGR